MSNGRNLGLLLGTSTVVPASALTEVSNLVDSDYVTQLSPVKITTANQSFDSNQETLLNLTAEISGVPNVAVFKEIPQTGSSSKGNWDVNSTASNYDFYNEATTVYAGVSITPSNSSTDGIFTLSTGTFTSQDIGKRIIGNGGEAIITATDGSYSLVTPFNNTSPITAGNWNLYGTTNTTDGISLSYYENLADVNNMTTTYNKTLGVGGYESRVTGVFLGNSGQNLYISGWTTLDKIAQFSLSAPYDITTASFLGYSPQFPDTVNTWGIHFSPDGTKVYLVSNEYDRVYQYNLTSPWDVTSWTSSGQLLMPNAGSNTANKQPRSCGFGDNGYIFYICDTWGEMFQFSLLTPYDISTATYNNFAVISGGSGFAFYDNGTRLLSLSSPGDQIRQVILSTPYDISTAGSSTILKQLSENMEAAHFVEGLYLVSGYYANIRLWNMGSYTTVTSQYIPAITNSIGRINTTSWLDINDMTPDETLNDGEVYYAISTDARTTWKVAKNGEGERSIARNNSGTWQYNSNPGNSVSSPFSMSSPSYESEFRLDDGSNGWLNSWPAVSSAFNNDGTKMYAIMNAYNGGQNPTVYEYNLSVAYDVSTASYNTWINVQPQTGNRGLSSHPALQFSPDGTYMYVTSTQLSVYTLSVPWNISTATHTRNISKTGFGTYDGLYVTSNGIICKSGSNLLFATINDYSLSTVGSVQTISGAFGSISVETLVANSDASKVFIHTNDTGSGNEGWIEYSRSSSNALSTSDTFTQINVWDHGLPYDPRAGQFSTDGTKMIIATTVTGGQGVRVFSTTGTVISYGTGETWTNSTYNNEHAALQQALTVSINRMNSTQLSELSDANEFVLGNSLDLMIAPYVSSGASPVSDGVTINYDAEAIIRQAILGTDYIVEQPTPGTIKVVSLTNQNLKIRVL